jgi:hypothetical protein
LDLTVIIDFWADFPLLSANARRHLGGIQCSLNIHPERRKSGMGLVTRLLAHREDTNLGLYVPLGDSVYLERKLSNFSEVPASINPAVGSGPLYFSNALLLPQGYPKFRLDEVPSPTDRLTNAGFLCVTHEFDPEIIDQFEEMLAWTSRTGPFTSVCNSLCRFSDYRGYCVVYSGR